MLEERTYSIRELSAILGTNGKQAINRKLETNKVKYTVEGRGDKSIYTITKIQDRFRVFCIFDLGFSPHTDFTKLRDFIFFLLGDDDFSWRPMEMMEEYLRIEGKGISRQTISKYIAQLKNLHLIADTDFVYYRVYHCGDIQKHELISKEEYSKAWAIYWDMKNCGYDSETAFSIMYSALGGVPRKQRKLEQNAIFQDTLSLLSELVAESFLLENGG